MAVRPVVNYPDPRLRQETVEVKEVTDEIRALVQDLTDSMYAENGAGIAAIQIGSPHRLYIIDPVVAGGLETDPPKVFINPEILSKSDDEELAEEGCLSFPGIYLQVKRSLRCRVRAMGMDGKPFEVEGEGLFARAMQHEGDHLTGTLLIDFAGALKKEMIKRKMKKAAKLAGDEEGAA